LGQIEPQTPRLVVSFRQFLQVSILQSYFPQSLKPWFLWNWEHYVPYYDGIV